MTTHKTQTHCLVVWKERSHATGYIIPVQFQSRSCQKTRLSFSGSIPFDRGVKQHIRRILLPAIDTICLALGLPKPSFEIITNTPQSLTGKNVMIQGHSADLPLFLGMLAAATSQPLCANMASTGCIKTKHGELQSIEDIQTKLQAAIDHSQIETVIHPNSAINNSINCIEVSSLVDAVKSAFEEKFTGSLLGGYFNNPQPNSPSSQLDQIAGFLVGGTIDDFQSRVHHWLTLSNTENASQMIVALLNYSESKSSYPKDFGTGLARIHHQLPAQIQQELVQQPILAKEQALGFAKLAGPNDFQDLYSLFEIAIGDFQISQKSPKPTPSKQLDQILDQCSPTYLARHFGIALDEARMRFTLKSAHVRSQAQFNQTITAYYIHMFSHLGELAPKYRKDQMVKNALKWVREGFQKNGGINSAFQEAKSPIQGGLRFILDYLCDYEKHKRMQEHMEYILTTQVDHLGFKFKTAFTKAFLDRFKTYLPSEIQNNPPEQYANSFQSIIQSYINSQTQFIKHIKSL